MNKVVECFRSYYIGTALFVSGKLTQFDILTQGSNIHVKVVAEFLKGINFLSQFLLLSVTLSVLKKKVNSFRVFVYHVDIIAWMLDQVRHDDLSGIFLSSKKFYILIC